VGGQGEAKELNHAGKIRLFFLGERRKKGVMTAHNASSICHQGREGSSPPATRERGRSPEGRIVAGGNEERIKERFFAITRGEGKKKRNSRLNRIGEREKGKKKKAIFSQKGKGATTTLRRRE